MKEVCSVPEESHSKKKKIVFTWHMVEDNKISLQDLYFLRHAAVSPGKQLLLFQRQHAPPKCQL